MARPDTDRERECHKNEPKGFVWLMSFSLQKDDFYVEIKFRNELEKSVDQNVFMKCSLFNRVKMFRRFLNSWF